MAMLAEQQRNLRAAATPQTRKRRRDSDNHQTAIAREMYTPITRARRLNEEAERVAEARAENSPRAVRRLNREAAQRRREIRSDHAVRARVDKETYMREFDPTKNGALHDQPFVKKVSTTEAYSRKWINFWNPWPDFKLTTVKTAENAGFAEKKTAPTKNTGVSFVGAVILLNSPTPTIWIPVSKNSLFKIERIWQTVLLLRKCYFRQSYHFLVYIGRETGD
jgi:hypothetical protein